ncbi:DEAD/DEAH box helicase family protein [Streptomyces bohaiensis]
MTAEPAADGAAATRPPHPLRRHQREALAGLEQVLAAGHRRAWVVLPPGLGKTLTGLEAARRLGRPVVVLGPNTAIQGQWVREWSAFRPEPPPAGTSRDLASTVTVLTYQALASFDPDAEVAEDGAGTAHLHRLRPGGRELVEAMRRAGEITLLLDECHHLLETWGELLAEVLRELPSATVVGLTATPPERLTRAQAALVEELFGPAVRGPSIPAAVREGHLAPYAELAWLTTPTPVEDAWLAGEAERFTELVARLMTPGFAGTDFLPWLDRRVVARTGPAGEGAGPLLPWHRFAAAEPALTDAALRLHHQGLLALPAGARLREEHRHPPRAEDWVALIDDWVRRCLRVSATEADRAAEAEIRAALPAVGHRLTARGVRRDRSPLDRVLARSAARTAAVAEILAAEADALGSRLRAVVICDHERATATLPARLAGVLDAEAGSARLVLATLAADERTAALAPVLVTGRTVAAAPATAEAFAAWCRERHPGLDLTVRPLPDTPGTAEVVGRWTSRRWVALATAYVEAGRTRALIGTRALLGEGWNARRVNTLVDLTEATTPTAVVQTRGRALRPDPQWPDKVAHTWSVVCVAPDHPRGTSDWDRFVRKHDGYLGVAEGGAVLAGVAHVDATLSPYAPPAAETFPAFNAAMLVRARDRARTRELWRVGDPYEDRLGHLLRVTADRGRRRPAPAFRDSGHRPPPAVPAARGTAPARPAGTRRRAAGVGAAATVLTGAAGSLAGADPALLAVPALAAGWAGHHLAATAARFSLWRAAGREPVVPAVARAVADGLHTAGLTDRGAAAVAVEPDGAGVLRIGLAGAPPGDSELFAIALDEAIGVVTAPRYLLPRHLAPAPGPRAVLRTGANAVVQHAVPTVLGENRRRADGYADAWNRYVSTGRPVWTRSPEGTGLLAAFAGLSPLEVTTALRLGWR